MVPAASVRIPRAPTYSGYISSLIRVSFTGLSPSPAGLPMPFSYARLCLSRYSFNPRPQSGLGSFHFARHYSGNHSYFLLLQVLRCFSSLRLAWSVLSIHTAITYISIRWVPPFGHRWVLAPAYCSPPRFAVCCVLLRLSVPRHSPYALHSLTLECFSLCKFFLFSFSW